MKIKRKFVYITVAALFLGLFFYILRGPDISNALKKLILPELELVTGKRFIAQKIYLNVFPLFVEMKDLKALDENGNKILTADRVKGYIGLFGLFRKEIVIKKIVLKKSNVNTNSQQMNEIIDNIKKYMAEETKIPFKITIKSFQINDGSIFFKDKDAHILLEGVNSEIILAKTPKVRISSKNAEIIKQDMPEIRGMLDTYFSIKKDNIELNSLKFVSYNSEIKTSGILWLEKLSGEFQTEINLFVDSVKRIFGLQKRGEGMISAHGVIKIDSLESAFKNLFFDLKLKGNFYLETLMELLKVEERLKGHISFKGELKGYLNNMHGAANAMLENGNLFGVDIDKMNCKISYKNGVMNFTEGSGVLYGGSAVAEAMIKLPVVDYYSFKVSAKDVSSKGVFKIIQWDPGIAEGRVNGDIASSGSNFNPHGNFSYKSIHKGKDILGRIREIKSAFNMKDDILYFPDMQILSGESEISAKGNIDFLNNTLNLTGSGKTANMKDFLSPYFTALSGPGSFNASISGSIKDPAIDMQFSSKNATFSTGNLGIPGVLKNMTLNLDSIDGIFTYRKNLMNVRNLLARSSNKEYRASGNIYFYKALSLFDLKEPDYKLDINMRSIDAKEFSDMFHDAPSFTGEINTKFKLYGPHRDVRLSGNLRGKDMTLYGKYHADYIDGAFAYGRREFSFSNLRLRKDSSTLNVDGKLSLNKRFSFIAKGQNLNLADAVPENLKEKLKSSMVESFSFTLVKIRGQGTFESPHIEIEGNLFGRPYKGQPIGKGDIKGVLKDKKVDVTAHFLDGKLNIKGGVSLSDALPWFADIELKSARCDFIIANFLKDVPEDLLLNLRGSIKAHGDRNHVNAAANIEKALLYLYGNGFTNSSAIIAKLTEKKLSIEPLTMKSENTEFKLKGSISIGRDYDIQMEGSSSLAPLKAVSKNMDVVRGNASFVFSLTGGWETPKINGGMDVTNGTIGFKNIPYRLTSISAYIYVDEDRIVIDKATGKLSGGDLNISGIAYLQKFSIKRFFLESQLKGITASVSKDFWVNFDGNLYYQGTLQSQTILGDISIKRARYSERTEWKSWLLKSRRQERPKIEMTKLDMTKLNVRVSGSNLLIDNNVARAYMKMDVLLRGTIGQPVLVGKVGTKGGIVYFRNNEFKIVKANVDFSSSHEINPYFDIVAETRVRNYNIRLSLDGYIEHFTLALSSDPSLNETDIFSLLTVGQVGQQLKGLQGGIGAGEATSFLTGKLQDVMEDRLKTITGFDRVQVDPYVSRTTGTVTPRVTLQKRLMGDSLYVTYSSSVGTGEEQIWKVEYILGKNTSLIGLRDEKGGLGGDIKFRFEFK